MQPWTADWWTCQKRTADDECAITHRPVVWDGKMLMSGLLTTITT